MSDEYKDELLDNEIPEEALKAFGGDDLGEGEDDSALTEEPEEEETF